MRWALIGLVVLASGCDSVLSLQKAMRRPDDTASSAKEARHGQTGDDAGVTEAPPSCSLADESCSEGLTCCEGSVCSPARTCVQTCEQSSDCESACCGASDWGTQRVCLAADECQTPSVPDTGLDAGSDDIPVAGAPAPGPAGCLAKGAKCTGSQTCCGGLCVEYGQDAARCEGQCTSDADCPGGCCRSFGNGRACVASPACEAQPCGGVGQGYRYWCVGQALHLCYDGMNIGSVPCSPGCTRAASDRWDACGGTEPCRGYPRQGGVCGTTLGVGADPDTLYTCQDQRAMSSEVCPNACVAADPNSADLCK